MILFGVPSSLSLPPFLPSLPNFIMGTELALRNAHKGCWTCNMKQGHLLLMGMPLYLYQNSRGEKQTFITHGNMGDQELLGEVLYPVGENSQEDSGNSAKTLDISRRASGPPWCWRIWSIEWWWIDGWMKEEEKEGRIEVSVSALVGKSTSKYIELHRNFENSVT